MFLFIIFLNLFTFETVLVIDCLFREVWGAFGIANNIAHQAFTNIRTVRAFGAEEFEIKRYSDISDDLLKKCVKETLMEAGAVTLVPIPSLSDFIAIY